MNTAIVEQEHLGTLPDVEPEVEAMAEAGLHLGHARAKRHPAMAPYLWGVRNNVEVIDLTRTQECLRGALAFLRTAASEGKLFLFVGTHPSAQELVRRTATELGYPFVDQRWIGGTLTNFKVIAKRIEAMEALEQESAGGGLEKYPKGEQAAKLKELARLRQRFDGLRRLRRLPEALVVLSMIHDRHAVAEASRTGIPVVGVADTNADPRRAAYPIPANDDARPALVYLLGRIQAAIREGQAAMAAPPDAAAADAPPAAEAAAPER